MAVSPPLSLRKTGARVADDQGSVRDGRGAAGGTAAVLLGGETAPFSCYPRGMTQNAGSVVRLSCPLWKTLAAETFLSAEKTRGQ